MEPQTQSQHQRIRSRRSSTTNVQSTSERTRGKRSGNEIVRSIEGRAYRVLDDLSSIASQTSYPKSQPTKTPVSASHSHTMRAGTRHDEGSPLLADRSGWKEEGRKASGDQSPTSGDECV